LVLKTVLLLLLVPYAIGLIWVLVKIGPFKTAVWWCALVTIAAVWALLRVVFVSDLFRPNAEEAFASVEYVMRDVSWDWLMNYTLAAYGPLLPTLYFVVCWVCALLLSKLWLATTTA
jgi:hypothetical protein